MAKLQDTRTITSKDGDTFELTVSKLEPVAAYLLVSKFGKILVPAFVAMRKGAETELQPIVDKVFDDLPSDLMMQVMLDVFAAATVVHRTPDGTATKHELIRGTPEINNAFRGNFIEMFKALGFALEVNFGDFFDASGLVTRMTRTPSA